MGRGSCNERDLSMKPECRTNSGTTKPPDVLNSFAMRISAMLRLPMLVDERNVDSVIIAKLDRLTHIELLG